MNKISIVMEQIKLIIAKEFSTAPGPRYNVEGDWSGEKFRKGVLLPKLLAAINEGKIVYIDLDGTAGYGTSFLEEAFGGLIREEHLEIATIKKHIEIKSNEEPYLIDDITSYLEDASNQVHATA